MDQIHELTDLICHARNMVFFTGAGVSTESGIPDFRGSQGLYRTEEDDGIPPETKLHRRYLTDHPEQFYAYYRTHMVYPDAKPNAAHYAPAQLEATGRYASVTVITQNIDGLFQAAGCRTVHELHGSAARNYCTACGNTYDLASVIQGDTLPRCTCGGLIRPDVVLYGEPLNEDTWYAAETAIHSADLLLVGGTSLTVYPAAGLIRLFRGEHMVIINQMPTPYDDRAELIIREPIGQVMTQVMAGL